VHFAEHAIALRIVVIVICFALFEFIAVFVVIAVIQKVFVVVFLSCKVPTCLGVPGKGAV
jgi:hypothetical protein